MSVDIGSTLNIWLVNHLDLYGRSKQVNSQQSRVNNKETTKEDISKTFNKAPQWTSSEPFDKDI